MSSVPCAACDALAADNRRREPHDRLVLDTATMTLTMPESGCVVNGMGFRCRDCGLNWRLLDSPNELFVTWIAESI